MGRARDGQRGGVSISGSVGSVGGDIVGGDKIGSFHSAAELDTALRPLTDAITAAPTRVRAEAESKLLSLKQEMAKGKASDDSIVARLVDGLLGLVPEAATAVISAFGTPILGGIAGPVTKFVLGKLKSEQSEASSE